MSPKNIKKRKVGILKWFFIKNNMKISMLQCRQTGDKLKKDQDGYGNKKSQSSLQNYR